ncbi:SpoIIE family protein phosphatase [Nonomuraea sp. NPDC052116]|uniref:SpoIIE family protein phosphatase n=1 Tax=Nonomuraea sp. NPDC052116 TaxID=3155665 RepID=UPI00341F6FBA
MNVPAGDTGASWTADGRRLCRLPDLSDAGAYVVDDRGRIVEVTAQAERLLCRPAEDLLGRDAHDLLHRGKYGEPLPRSRCAMRQPLIVGGSAQGEGEWFEHGDGVLMRVSWMVTPCRLDEGRTGALVLFHESPGPAPYETAAATASMSQLDRLALLAETTTTLTASLDVDETLRQLVRLVLPLLADWAVVDLLTEEGGVSRAAVAHFEGGLLTYRDDLEGPMPPVPQESPMPLSRALRGVTATLVSPETYQGLPDSGIAVVQQELFRVTGMHSACIAPIRGVRDVVGALTLGRSGQPATFTTADLLLVEDIARRAGLALDNARLYERQRRVAETMQRHLLPQLPSVPGLEMSASYRPAPHASQVGGDWYDSFVLPDGAKRRDDGGWRLRWTNAGHPPPLLVERDGRTRFLEEGQDLLLGTGIPTVRVDATADLPPRSTLVLYTDGLIESPTRTLDEGMSRLSRYAASMAQRPVASLGDVLIDRVRPADNDDVALLTVRIPDHP